jgi:hypothetical protein
MMHNVCQVPSEAWIDDRVQDRAERVYETDLDVVFVAAAQAPQPQEDFFGRNTSAWNRKLIAKPAR